MSRVDVIIPCYNYGRYLPGCVRSVLGQQGVDVRILIIDDASPDGSCRIAEELGRQDDRIKVRRHAVNRGHIATYNEGLDWVAGNYALLLSADDLLIPGALRRAAMLLDAHPEVGLTYGRQIPFSSDEPPEAPSAEVRAGSWHILAGSEFIAECCRSGSNPVTTPTAVVRTTLWKKLGGYRKDLPHTADMELWLRFAAHAAVAVIDADQAMKRVHPGNMQHEYVRTDLGDLPHRLAAFEALFSECDIRFREALRFQARAALAEEAFWAASSAFDRGDLACYEQCLAYAQRLSPTVCAQPTWARLQWKRFLGPWLWGLVRPLVKQLRSSCRRAELTARGSFFSYLRPDETRDFRQEPV
jgi:glycosyltransferase involved in cell wall biosynthesis